MIENEEGEVSEVTLLKCEFRGLKLFIRGQIYVIKNHMESSDNHGLENKDSVYVNFLIKKCLRESTLHLGYSQHSKSPSRCANIWKQRF